MDEWLQAFKQLFLEELQIFDPRQQDSTLKEAPAQILSTNGCLLCMRRVDCIGSKKLNDSPEFGQLGKGNN